MNTRLEESSKAAIYDCLRAQQDEVVLVVADTDPVSYEIGKAFFEVAKQEGNESLLLVMLPRSEHGEEPPEIVGNAMKKASVILAPTSKSITHTGARRDACSAGARVASMPGITMDMMLAGGMSANYKQISALGQRLLGKVLGGQKALIKSDSGTEITCDLSERTWFLEHGICMGKGECTNLPAGEVYISPKSADGIIAIDRSMAGLGLLRSPIYITVEQGRAISFEGERSKDLQEIITRAGSGADNLAELGIGINPCARIVGVALEDEKVLGTIHFGFGDSSHIGGSVGSSIHLDGVVGNCPELFLDGHYIELVEPSWR